MLVWPASSHKGLELAEREKITDRPTAGPVDGRRNEDRGSKKASDLQGKKVIHPDVQINIYLLSIYHIWF